MDPLDRSSDNVLNRYTTRWFEGESLVNRIGRTLCLAECVSRKEFFESWETAKRLRRQMRGGTILELAAGHGLLSAMLLLLDDTSPSATLVDTSMPPSFAKIYAVLRERWPQLSGRLNYVEGPLEEAVADSHSLVVSIHACGTLTDRVLDMAISAGCRVGVVPCCHDYKRCDTGGLTNWMEGSLAIDAMRVARLRHQGFRVAALNIPRDITPKNHLLLAWPEPKGPVDEEPPCQAETTVEPL
ncbi:SAM-dependent methyltransferase [Myxococcota bacterium]|nr:SAM-dependent methyltransferase [Myxococcota bacterium]MBU1536180.1 SAM-dependent methyltransferase [Myxococcota bacterium]